MSSKEQISDTLRTVSDLLDKQEQTIQLLRQVLKQEIERRDAAAHPDATYRVLSKKGSGGTPKVDSLFRRRSTAA